MNRATKALIGYVVGLPLVLGPYATSACDDQSDPGSMVITLSGSKNTEIKAGSSFEGRYRVNADGDQKDTCRWRVYTPDKTGHWRQASPKKFDAWNRVGQVTGRGSVTLTGHVLFQSRGCPSWEMRK